MHSDEYAPTVEKIQALSTKEERDNLKATLAAITPSGVFTYREASQLVHHSGFLQFDIDGKDHAHIGNFVHLKRLIANINVVAYCGLSVSGTGFWGLVKIAYPERHSQHFDALYRLFSQYGIMLDTKPRSVASLRGYSYDPDAYFNHQAATFQIYDEPVRDRPSTFRPSDERDEARKVEACIAYIIHHQLDITGDYGQWRDLGASLFKAFGEQGRDYFHQISQFYPSYSSVKTDRQFNAGRTLTQFGLGTFFKICDLHSIHWKDLLPATH
ncbi:hypothetical protein GCM10028773_58310 [Spirosoma koreense]